MNNCECELEHPNCPLCGGNVCGAFHEFDNDLAIRKEYGPEWVCLECKSKFTGELYNNVD